MKGFRLGDIFKIKEGKVVKDEKAAERKVDVSTRIKRKTSKRIKFVKRTEQDFRG